MKRTASSAPIARPAMPQGRPARHPVAAMEGLVLAPHLWQKRAPGESAAPQAWQFIGAEI